MKDKKLIVLYILMLVTGFILLFTSSSNKQEPQAEQGPTAVQLQPKEVTQYVTVAIANKDIHKGKIFTADDYVFKNIEVKKSTFDSAKYISQASDIDSYAAKNNIEQGTMIMKDFVASPVSLEYITLSLKDGFYLFPFEVTYDDNYLIKNLKGGDLVDIYVLYSVDQGVNRGASVSITSPPNKDFLSSNIKPIIVGKDILYIDNKQGSNDPKNNNKKENSIIYLSLSNEELKLVRTLMNNASLMLYPSTFNHYIEDSLYLLSEKERGWPLSERKLFNQQKQIMQLRGN